MTDTQLGAELLVQSICSLLLPSSRQELRVVTERQGSGFKSPAPLRPALHPLDATSSSSFLKPEFKEVPRSCVGLLHSLLFAACPGERSSQSKAKILAWQRLHGDHHAIGDEVLTQCPAREFSLSKSQQHCRSARAPCSWCGGLQLPQVNLVLVQLNQERAACVEEVECESSEV